MAKKESAELSKLNIWANYWLMLTILVGLLGFFMGAGRHTIQGVLFLLCFAGFFLLAGYIAVKYKAIFRIESIPITQQKKRQSNRYVGYAFLIIALFLILTAIKNML
ncbi:MAG: hypothetical protein QW404_00675 [Candidatus Nanoarchaeia archaeon]